MTFIDLFAGIGGFRLGMEMAGHKCLGHCEWDKYANYSYTAMHLLPAEELKLLEDMDLKESQKFIKERKVGGEWFAKDIREVRANDIPKCDCWCFGFPCQDISIAGQQKGFTGKRSSLFFAVTKLIRELEEKDKPTYLFIENVKNLLSINRGLDFAKLLIELDEIGYDAQWQVLNSSNFGVPQNRQRVFIVGHLRTRKGCGREIFPIYGKNNGTLKQIIGGMQGHRIYDATGIASTLVGNAGGLGAKTGLYCIGNVNPSGKGINGNVFHLSGISPTLTTNKGEGIKIAIPKFIPTPNDVNRTIRTKGWNTPTSKHNFNTVYDGARIRKLTPKECFRLQGFPDEYFNRARLVNSDSQLYKQAGNGVTVTVVYEIAKRMEVQSYK